MATLGSLCLEFVDCEHKTAPLDDDGEYFAVGTPAMRGNVINYDEARRISRQVFESWTRRLTPKPGDILFAREAPVGPVVRIPEGANVAPGQRTVLMRVDASKADPSFIYFLLTGPDVQRRIHDRAAGSTVPHLNVPDIKDFDLGMLPFLPEQRAIAEVLGALDDKIAANDRLVAVSEKLMVALAATASGATCLEQLAEQSRASLTPSSLGAVRVSHYSLPAFDSGVLPAIEPADAILSGKFVVSQPSVLVSKLNPRFPRVWNVPVVEGMALASTEFVVLEPKSLSTSVLWSVLSQPGLGQTLVDKASGTSGSHQRVRPQELLDAEVVDPRTLASAVLKRLGLLGERVHVARNESWQLARLRDALLPELMSGRMRVKDVVREVEEAL